jgi:DNA-binding PadR family transcriptional regulator
MHDHDPRWDRAWRRMEQMARRGFKGFGNEWGGLGDNLRVGRMLASGDLRLVALFLIEQQPRHGYDLIKAVEEKSAGFYSPSPGIVYPALTYLEEAGYVTSGAEGNKKLYTITDEGRRHLADNRQAVESTLDFLGKVGERVNDWRRGVWDREGERDERQARRHPRHWGQGPGWGPGAPGPDRDIRDVVPELNEARRELKDAIREAVRSGGNGQRRAADILRRAAADIRRPHAAPEEDDDFDL